MEQSKILLTFLKQSGHFFTWKLQYLESRYQNLLIPPYGIQESKGLREFNKFDLKKDLDSIVVLVVVVAKQAAGSLA